MSNCWIEFEQPEERRGQDVGRQHRQGDAEEDEAAGHAVERRRLEGLGRQAAEAGEQEDHDEGGVDPDVDEHDGEERGRGRGGPAEVLEPDQAREVAEHAEAGVGHQLPHQRRQRRRGHQRHQEHDRDEVVDPRALLQQERDAEAEQELEHHRDPGVEQRDAHGVPEARIAQEVQVVLAPVELARPGLAQPVALQRVDHRGQERDQDADADEKRRQAEQVGQRPLADPEARAAVPGRVGGGHLGISVQPGGPAGRRARPELGLSRARPPAAGRRRWRRAGRAPRPPAPRSPPSSAAWRPIRWSGRRRAAGR